LLDEELELDLDEEEINKLSKKEKIRQNRILEE